MDIVHTKTRSSGWSFPKTKSQRNSKWIDTVHARDGSNHYPRIDKLFEISAVLDGSWRTPVCASCDGAADVCSDQIGKVLDVIIKCPKCYEVKQNITQKEWSVNYTREISEIVHRTRSRMSYKSRTPYTGILWLINAFQSPEKIEFL